jgi:hypothetical protein
MRHLRRASLVTVAAAFLVFLGCGEDKPTDPNGQSIEALSIEIRDPRLIGPSVLGPGDSSSEECEQNQRCVIQGLTYESAVRVYCPQGPGNCGEGTFEWEALNPPPTTEPTFDPPVTELEEWSDVSIETDSTTPSGVYNFEYRPNPLGSTGTPNPATLQTHLRAMCNYKYNSCPVLEIVDTDRDTVVSKPAPDQNTAIGRRVNLLVRHKPGTGGSFGGLSNIKWNLEGHEDDHVVRGYTFTRPEGDLDRYSAGELDEEEIPLHYALPGNGYSITVEATLTRSGSSSTSRPRATATYNAAGPSTSASQIKAILNETWSIGTRPDAPGFWLSFGDPNGTAGIRDTVRATADGPDTGYVAGTQVFAWGENHEPVDSIWMTDGNELDTCVLFEDYSEQGFNNTYTWHAEDTPGVELRPQDDLVQWETVFSMYYMYRPKGDESIWVPLGMRMWGVAAQAERTGSPVPPLMGWTITLDTALILSKGTTTDFPQWEEFYAFDPEDPCPALP